MIKIEYVLLFLVPARWREFNGSLSSTTGYAFRADLSTEHELQQTKVIYNDIGSIHHGGAKVKQIRRERMSWRLQTLIDKWKLV
jgi:hypothetical protein